MTKPLPASSRLYKLLMFLFEGSECQQNLITRQIQLEQHLSQAQLWKNKCLKRFSKY